LSFHEQLKDSRADRIQAEDFALLDVEQDSAILGFCQPDRLRNPQHRRSSWETLAGRIVASHDRRELFAIELNEGQTVQIRSWDSASRHTHGAKAFAITFERTAT
jgi:hypothetical protein